MCVFCGSQHVGHKTPDIVHCSGSSGTCCSALHTGSKRCKCQLLLFCSCQHSTACKTFLLFPHSPENCSLLKCVTDLFSYLWAAHNSNMCSAHRSNVFTAHCTGWQISKSCWFWFQIWHQLIILFGFWVGTCLYPDFFSVSVSNLIIISHNATFQDWLFP